MFQLLCCHRYSHMCPALEMFTLPWKWKSFGRYMKTDLQVYCVAESTCELQVEASIWKYIFWMWGFFFPSPESLLPWQQQKICSKGSWASERVSWARRGMAVPNKQALSLTVSRVLLLLPSHCSPHPLPSPPPPPLTPLLSFDIRLLFSWFVVQMVSTHFSHPTHLFIFVI